MSPEDQKFLHNDKNYTTKVTVYAHRASWAIANAIAAVSQHSFY